MPILAQLAQKRLMCSDHKITKLMCEGETLYSSGNIVTYRVDSGIVYSEERDSDEDILTPKTFTPSKDGWIFIGWKEDTEADSSIIEEKVMDSDLVTLYAVFEQDVTVTFITGIHPHIETTEKTGRRYYNNGTITNASVYSASGRDIDDWTWRGWADRGVTEADAEVAYGSYDMIDGLESDATYRALYQRTFTLTYYDNSSVPDTKTGINYYNSSTRQMYPSFTMLQSSKSGWTPRGWSKTNTADASVDYSNDDTIMLTGDMTIYGLYQQTVTVTYYNNSTVAKTSARTRYWAPAETIDPTFTLTQATVSGWTPRGWSTATTGNAAVAYNNETEFTVNNNITLYGMYQRTVVLSYNGNNATGGSTASQTATAYRNYAGTIINASFRLNNNGYSRTNYSFVAWAQGSVSGTQRSAGDSVSLSADTVFYAVWLASSWYLLQNKAWTVDTTGTVLNSGWTMESGNEGGWGVQQYGINNSSGAGGSWSSIVIDTKGCRTITIKLSNCRFENAAQLMIRNRSVSTDAIFSITSVGTHTFTLPDNCEQLQLAVWMADGHWIYIDEIYMSS